jgi:hypothetical protein
VALARPWSGSEPRLQELGSVVEATLVIEQTLLVETLVAEAFVSPTKKIEANATLRMIHCVPNIPKSQRLWSDLVLGRCGSVYTFVFFFFGFFTGLVVSFFNGLAEPFKSWSSAVYLLPNP